MYSMDDSQLLWKGKPARLAKGATGRRITDTMATDGRTLYFAQKRVALPDGIDLDALRMRVFDENPVNLIGAVLDDGQGVWQLTQRGLLEVHRLDGADFDTLERFDTPGIYFDHHVRDHQHVWYRGERVVGLDAARARLLAEHVATDGEQLWIFGQRSEELRPHDITRVWSSGNTDLIRTDDSLLQLEGRGPGITTRAHSTALQTPDEIARLTLRALGRDLFGVFETVPQIVVPLGDIDWDAVHATERPTIDARFDGASIVLETEDTEPVRCDADGWYGALCTLWLRRRGMSGTLITYPYLGIMLPDGEEFRQLLIKRHRDLFLQYCGAAFAQGAHAGARLMLRSYTQAVRFRRDTPFDDQDALVASLPRALFEAIEYDERRFQFRNTTNLSAARHAVDSGLLADPDPRVRLEMLSLVHGTVLATNKLPLFFQRVLPAILTRQDDEPLASLREQADTVVEAFIIAALVRSEVWHDPMAEKAEPLIRRQLARGINVPLNRARLIEVLIHQGREGEAIAAVEEFKSDFGADFMLPGLYASRPLHPTVDDAVAAMRERAAELTSR